MYWGYRMHWRRFAYVTLLYYIASKQCNTSNGIKGYDGGRTMGQEYRSLLVTATYHKVHNLQQETKDDMI
jgi:hypothetical protein